MKLKPIPNNTVVHTPTETEAKELLRILHGCGYEWSDHKPLTGNTYWETYGEDTVYIACAGLVDKADMSAQHEWRGLNPIYTFADVKKLFCTEEPDNDAPLNLCELLKGHEGEIFYSPIYEEITIEFDKESGLMEMWPPSKGAYLPIASNGHLADNPEKGQCLIFPSRALYEQYPLDPYTAWMKWQEEQKKYILLMQLHKINLDGTCGAYDVATRYAFLSPSDRDKCIEEIKAVIEKYKSE